MICSPSLLNASFKHLNVCGGIDMHNSGLTNVNTINGQPIGSSASTSNLVNVYFKPNAPMSSSSNIYGAWSDILTLASQLNVNQILNIYFDNSISSCIINQSYDFKGKASFYSASTGSFPVSVTITSGTTISNIKGIYKNLTLICDSVTVPSLAFDPNASFELMNGSTINNTETSLVPSIIVDGSSLALTLYLNSAIFHSGNSSLPLIRVINNTTMVLINDFNPITPTIINDTIANDGTGTLLIQSDSSWNEFPTFSNFTGGTYTKQMIDNSSLVSYDDSKSTSFGSTNVQGALDSLKTSITTGSITAKNTSNQITLGTTNTVTLDSKAPASSLTYTIIDQSNNCNVSLGINKFLPVPEVLTPADSGSVYGIGSIVPITIMLPPMTNGLKYTFIVNSIIGQFITISSPTNNTLYGSILSADGLPVDSGAITTPRTFITLYAVAVIGDKYVFKSDGTYWYVYGVTSNHESVNPGIVITGIIPS